MRNSLQTEDDVRLAVSKMDPNCDKVVETIQNQGAGGGRRGGGNWGRGRNYQQQGSFERAFSHGGQNVGQGGFASGRHDYKS